MRQLIAALTLIAATTSAAFAQDEADVDGVRAAVMAYFNAGNTGDPDLAREAFYTSTGDMFIYRNDEDGERVDARVVLCAFENEVRGMRLVSRRALLGDVQGLLDERL